MSSYQDSCLCRARHKHGSSTYPYLSALLEGVLDSWDWRTARFGTAGEQARFPTKVAAACENGRRGSRPPKIIVGE